ncbi:MAG: hypothetical protein AB7F66_03050 [Bacteriovoracia bacterium]
MGAEPKAKSASGAGQDEIDQIMNELEKLQNEIASSGGGEEHGGPQLRMVPQPDATAEEDGMGDFRAGSSEEPSLEETLGDMKDEEPAEGSLLATATATNVTPVRSKNVEKRNRMPSVTTETESGTLTMNLTGNMTLKLTYEFEGQEVSVCFVDQCLKVELSDGSEFKIPVRRAA